MRRAAVHTTLLTAGVAQPMLQLYGGNPAVFTSARMSGADVVWFALLVLLAPVAAVTVLDMLAGLAPVRIAGRVRQVLVGVSALPLGLLLVRGMPGPWPVAAVLAVLVATVVAVTVARFRGVRTWASWMSPLAPAVLVLFLIASQSVVWEAEASVVSVATTVPASSVPAGPATDPSEVSVLWLQLDEAPLWPLLASDGTVNAARFPGFAALASESTWYRNALGLSQTTVDAVPAMLSGRVPVTGRAPTYSNHRRNLFSLAYGNRAMDVHEIATALCPKDACATVSVSGDDSIAAGGTAAVTVPSATTVPAPSPEAAVPPPDRPQFLRDAVVVLGHKLLPTGLRDRLPRIDEGWGGFARDGGGDTDDVTDSEFGESSTTATTTSTTSTTAAGLGSTTAGAPQQSTTSSPATTVVRTERNTVRGWERDGARSQVPVVRGMIERAARSSLPTVHFAHVLLPHRPWQLTPDMRTTRFVSTDERDATVEDRVRDEYQAILAQYAATDSLVLQLVRDMKRSANWDRTMVIVTSDHGIAFEPGESKRKDVNPRRVDTLEEIYRVPLFVKWPDQREPSVSDCPVQGFDLMPSVVAATGLDAGWEFDGRDIRTSCPVRTERTVWWDKGSAVLTSGFAAARATAARFDAWVDADGDTDGIAMTAGLEDWFDATVPADAPRETAVTGWTLRDSPLFADVGTAEFERVPLQVDGTIRTVRAPGAGATGLIVADGRVVAVLPEVSGMRTGRNPWRSILLPSSLTAGRHEPELFVARGTPAAPSFTRVGPPG